MMSIPQLRQIVGQQIGLPATFDGSIAAYGNLSRASQIELTQKMLDYIKEHPGDFEDKQVATANAEGARDLTLVDSSFSWESFQQEFEANAYDIVGKPFVAIGTGVSNTVTMIGTLLPFAVIVAVIIFALPYIKKANAPVS